MSGKRRDVAENARSEPMEYVVQTTPRAGPKIDLTPRPAQPATTPPGDGEHTTKGA